MANNISLLSDLTRDNRFGLINFDIIPRKIGDSTNYGISCDGLPELKTYISLNGEKYIDLRYQIDC